MSFSVKVGFAGKNCVQVFLKGTLGGMVNEQEIIETDVLGENSLDVP